MIAQINADHKFLPKNGRSKHTQKQSVKSSQKTPNIFLSKNSPLQTFSVQETPKVAVPPGQIHYLTPISNEIIRTFDTIIIQFDEALNIFSYWKRNCRMKKPVLQLFGFIGPNWHTYRFFTLVCKFVLIFANNKVSSIFCVFWLNFRIIF